MELYVFNVACLCKNLDYKPQSAQPSSEAASTIILIEFVYHYCSMHILHCIASLNVNILPL